MVLPNGPPACIRLAIFALLTYSVSIVSSMGPNSQPSLAQGSDQGRIGDMLKNSSSKPTYTSSPLSLIPVLSSLNNLSDASAITCYQPTPDRIITQSEYLGLLQAIVVDEDALVMRKWIFRSDDTEMWQSGRCAVGIGPALIGGPPLYAEFQFVIVAHLMARIAQQCFKPPRQSVGGYMRWGFKQEFLIVMGVGSTEPP